MKIGIVGAGQVGATAAYAMTMRGVGSEIVLVDRNADLAVAQAHDILDATPWSYPIRVRAGETADLDGAGIVVLAAGASQKPGESRLNLLSRNAAIFAEIVPAVLTAARVGFEDVLAALDALVADEEVAGSADDGADGRGAAAAEGAEFRRGLFAGFLFAHGGIRKL